MLDLMTRHPQTVGETYGEHLATAWSFGGVMILAGLACLVHGLLPFAFERTGSRSVIHLHKRMAQRHTAPVPPSAEAAA